VIDPEGHKLVLFSVSNERHRQEQLKAEGRFLNTPADSVMTPSETLAVLGEEFGEVAREVAESVAGKPLATDRLRAELVQVAAVCVAWVERLDREHIELEKCRHGKAPRAEQPCEAFPGAGRFGGGV
jgi:hypothetical protein